MASELRMGRNLLLPIEAVTETFAFLAKRGAGKSYTASVMVEGMLDNRLQVVILDPMGIWYGLRTKADGKRAGYQIPILGGEHGDIPLDSTTGKHVADLIVTDRVSAVLDVSLMTKGERKRFVADFAERLYRKNRTAMHLVMEESDMFAPQRPQAGEQRMLGAIEDIVRRGRSRGIGVSLICQRPAVLNKDVLTQTECLVALRTTAPHDRKAIKDWIDAHADRDQQRQVLDSLPSLPTGTAWFWSPSWLNDLKKVRINRKKTLDTGATPKAGERRKPQKTVAEVDLSQLTQKMTDTIERAKSEDPKHLRAKIAKLERELTVAKSSTSTDADVETAVRDALAVNDSNWSQRLDACLEENNENWEKALSSARDAAVHAVKGAAESALQSVRVPQPTRYKSAPAPTSVTSRPAARSSSSAPAGTQIDDTIVKKAGPRKCLIAVAQHDGVLKNQLCALTGYAPRSIETHVSALRIAGMVSTNWPLRATTEGINALGSDYEPLPTGSELFLHWKHKLPQGPRRVLDIIVAAGDTGVEKLELITRTGYAARSIETHTSALKVRRLIEKRGRAFHAVAELFDA